MPFIILFIFGAITLYFKGAELMMEGGLASEHFFTFLLMTGLVAGSIGGIAAQFSALQRGLGAIESLMELMEESREEVVTQQDQAYPALQLRGDVSFEDVHFHYANRADVNVLTGVNLRIEPGKRVALVGPSGAGKSTIASLLQRFHDPTAGVIKVDGQPLDQYDLTGFRKRIAFVPQEVILFGGDIRSNIAYGKTDALTRLSSRASQRPRVYRVLPRWLRHRRWRTRRATLRRPTSAHRNRARHLAGSRYLDSG